MRKILIFITLMGFIFLGCKPSKKEPAQSGAYKLEKLTVSGGGKDSVYARTQVKIYTDTHFIYASLAPDSSVGFGVGAYKLDTGNRIIEYNLFSSRALDSTQTFNLAVTKKDSGYTQVLPMASASGVKYTVTEVYTKLPASSVSKLDGLWKLDAAYTVTGKDSVKQNETQFKAFWGGHFMFVHRYPIDKLGTKFKNGFGYGDFTFKNDTISEEDQISSHALLLNRTFAVAIKFDSDDQYRQVISDPKTNSQSVEIYRRVR